MATSLTLVPVIAEGATAEGAAYFRERFEDADLQSRGWYDVTQVRIAANAAAGKGCIEYEWTEAQSGVRGSSPARHLFEPTEEVAIRFYCKLSKGWGWSGQNYHPHLTHFLTTENSAWHGPAASHLTLYIEPVGGKQAVQFTVPPGKGVGAGRLRLPRPIKNARRPGSSSRGVSPE